MCLQLAHISPEFMRVLETEPEQGKVEVPMESTASVPQVQKREIFMHVFRAWVMLILFHLLTLKGRACVTNALREVTLGEG